MTIGLSIKKNFIFEEEEKMKNHYYSNTKELF